MNIERDVIFARFLTLGASYLRNMPIEEAMDAAERRISTNEKFTIVEAIGATLRREFVDEETAARRLDICKKCPDLVLGTCKHCGCLMKVKVHYRDAICEAPKPRW
jgi:hypothetical protein